MMLPDDLREAAVAAVERALTPLLWDVAPQRRQRVAEAAVHAAALVLDGAEKQHAQEADQ